MGEAVKCVNLKIYIFSSLIMQSREKCLTNKFLNNTASKCLRFFSQFKVVHIFKSRDKVDVSGTQSTFSLLFY